MLIGRVFTHTEYCHSVQTQGLSTVVLVARRLNFCSYSDLVDGLIKLMNSNVSTPVNLVSYFFFNQSLHRRIRIYNCHIQFTTITQFVKLFHVCRKREINSSINHCKDMFIYQLYTVISVV